MKASILPIRELPGRLARLARFVVVKTLDWAGHRSWLLMRRVAFLFRTSVLGEPSAVFQCNICGRKCAVPRFELKRESVTCCACGSTVRFRAVVHAVLTQVNEKPVMPLKYMSADRSIVGYGLSDDRCYAPLLAKKFRYCNTYYDREPQLDITSLSHQHFEPADFIIASDVLEHVAPPVGVALRNLHELLRPEGFLIVTVPIVGNEDATEHYPRLHRYRFERDGTGTRLVNETAEGEVEVFPEPVFHHGPGATLEMRRFSLQWLAQELKEAGFVDIEALNRDVPEWGISWNGDLSPPIVARRPG